MPSRVQMSAVLPFIVAATFFMEYLEQFTTLGTLAYADVTDAQKGPASMLWSVAQQMTIGMGIAFGAVCLRLSGNDSAPFALADFHWAFAAASTLVLFSVIGYARLARGAGSAIGGG